ncbi:hypothetical protein [Nocardia sp. CC227C]|uniref:hypothetical protein n=1 Tax=Nocardia sp. CC227C TaxID=3044562 RepID=UPI00278C3240|nr:hypothetical protein [Nocardia sp. CC227C]
MTTTEQVGMVFCPADAPPDYQLHVIGHELWHLIRGHECSWAEWDTAYGSSIAARLARRREAMCDRFGRRLALVAKQQRMLDSQPIAEVMLGDAFGLWF